MAGPKLDDVQGDLLDALRAFVPRDVACRAVGVPLGVMDDWVERGLAAKSGKLRAFAVEVDKAEAKAEMQLILRMAAASRGVPARGDAKAVPPDPRATQWLLERGRPERWARKSVSSRVAPAGQPDGAARPPAPGEGEGQEWDLHNVRPIRPGG